MKSLRNPDVFWWGVMWLVGSVGAWAWGILGWSLDWFLSAFIAANTVTFLCMALDKLLASVQMRRIPESVFYLMVFLGGSFGMIASMMVFRHKTRKPSFQFVVALLILLQLALLVWYAQERSLWMSPLF